MKKHLLLLFFLQISCVAFSQTSFRVRLDSAYYNYSFAFPHFENKIVRCVDGGYGIAGYNYDNTVGLSVKMIKTDSNGLFAWCKVYGLALYEIGPVNLVAAPDSGFYLTYTETIPLSNWDAVYYMTKISKTGNVIFSKTSSGSGIDRYVIRMFSKEKRMNNLNMLWQRANLDANGSLIGFSNFFCRMDSVFNILFSKDLNLPSGVSPVYQDICTGGITTGYLVGGQSTGVTNKSVLMKLDTLGNLVWRKIYTGVSYTGIVSIEQVDSNFYLLEAGIRKLALRKIDFYGNTIFYNVIDSGYFTHPSAIRNMNMIHSDSSHLIITGTYYSSEIIETDLNGNVTNAMESANPSYTSATIDRDSKSLLFANVDTINQNYSSPITFEVEHLNNLACNYSSFNLYPSTNISTDSSVFPVLNSISPNLFNVTIDTLSYYNIVSVPICSSGVFTNTNYSTPSPPDLEIYPNPTTATVTVHTTKPFKNAQLVIFNSLGEKIVSSIYDGTKTINCKTFSKGIYFVRIADGEKQVTKKLVVE